MKTYLKHTSIILLLLMMGSCRNSEKKPPNNNNLSERQAYKIDTAGISILWTAYKFTNKVGVSGTFDTYTFDSKNTSGSIENILNKSKLLIPTESVNSGNAIRDFKLETYFFKAFNTTMLKGTITNAKASEGELKLKMNGITHKTPYTYAFANDTIVLFTNLNLTKWKAEKALKKLNNECFELHKGADGLSVLWPDVDVAIKIPVIKMKILE
jgi:hypothetical protein